MTAIRDNGRDHSPANTRLLRALLRNGRIRVDAEAGTALQVNGKPYRMESNWCGYLRFQVRTPKGRKWFFVHKAIYVATGGRIRKGYEIDHINHNTKDNRRVNLRYVTMSANIANRKPEPEIELPF